MSYSTPAHDHILSLLIAKGILNEGIVKNIIQESEGKKTPLLSLLVQNNYISAPDLEDLLSQEIGLKVVDLSGKTIPQNVIDKIDQRIALKYHCVPFRFEDETLFVAVSNPYDVLLVDDLKIVVQFPLEVYCALPYKIEEVLSQYYKEDVAETDSDEQIEDIIKEVEAEELEVVEARDTVDFNTIGQAIDETPVIKLTNYILSEAVKRRASDIFIEPWEKHMAVRCRVDGLLEEMKAPPKSMANSIVSRIKVMSNLDIAERRMPQDGRFKIKFHDRFVDMRVSVLPTSFGEKVCLRILDKKAQTQKLGKLGFQEFEMERIKEAARKPNGMLLVTGPTGSGKTTTLYSVLAHLDSPEKNITTVEDPVEYQMYGVNQVNIRDAVGLTFPAALRSILRQDPDVVMIGEIRDHITMDIAIKAALTGHLVLSTLHTNDASGTIVRITNMGIEPFLIASSVLMISAQRLIRKICSDCKEPYNASKELVKELCMDEGKQLTLYRAVGCEECRHTGYRGRTVITEVLPITAHIKELVMNRETAEVIKNEARHEGMSTLRESGISKVVAGESTIEEVYRVTAADQPLKKE